LQSREDKLRRGAVSGWVRQRNQQGVEPILDSDDVPMLLSLTTPPFRLRAEAYLRAAADHHPELAAAFSPSEPELVGSSYSWTNNEADFIARYLEDSGYLQTDIPGSTIRITAAGRIAADDLISRRAVSSQGFVAMWFDKAMLDVYQKGIEPAIAAAGYAALIINNKEHSNKIDDEIVSEIRRSAFVVADFTGHRGGVYFEAGFALGLGLPVIWTCRKDALAELHFDIRQYNCIDWSSAGELADRLRKRITAMFGQGPVAP